MTGLLAARVDYPDNVATPVASEIGLRAGAGRSVQWLEAHSTADVTFTPEGVLLAYNSAAERMFRVPTGLDLHGENVLGYCVVPARLVDVVRGVQLTGRIENWDCEFRRMDGSTLHTVVNLVGNFDSNRTLTSLRAHIFNITEWRRGHDRALFACRVEALGRFAGDVAHDFNNLLTVILGNAERLLLAAGDGPLRPAADAIIDSSTRAAELTRQLLAFGRRQVLQPHVVNLNDLLQTVEADVRRTFGRRIAVAVDVDLSLAAVHVDPDQIEDVLSTLAAHSVDAMADGGTLALRTRHAEISADRPAALCVVQPGSYVQIEMAHNGDPLDSDTHVRLLEPFCGDAGPGRQGRGLAAAFAVVKQSGGYIWVSSAIGAATTFTLLFPVHEQPMTVAATSEALAVATATILVVDDEDAIRRFVGDSLRAAGYAVLEASAAADGELIVASSPGRVDLVITDVNLGGVSGPELGARLRQQSPHLKLLYISGGDDDLNLGAEAHTSFLQKPFGAKLVVQRVRELLAA